MNENKTTTVLEDFTREYLCNNHMVKVKSKTKTIHI